MNETDIDSVSVAKSTESRVIAPDVRDINSVSLGTGNRKFSSDLYQALRKEEGNQFFSPYSKSAVLAMTHTGARV